MLFRSQTIAKLNREYGNIDPNFTQGFAPSYGAGVNTNTLAGIAAASGGGITVNVNGAIDPEGTARTIVNTLNSSFYRGTGGAGGLVTA